MFTGIVGNGILYELLKVSEFKVVALVRSKAGVDSSAQQQAIINDLICKGLSKDNVMDHLTVLCEIQEDGDMSHLCDVLSMEGIGAIDHVISCFGGAFEKGTISSLSEQDLRDSIGRSIPHFRLIKAILSHIKDDSRSSYLFITGMLGERCHIPQVAGLTLANSFLYGIILAFQSELLHLENKVRINEIRIGAMLQRRDSTSHPFLESSSSAYPSDLVGYKVLEIIRGTTDREIIRMEDSDFDTLLNVKHNKMGN